MGETAKMHDSAIKGIREKELIGIVGASRAQIRRWVAAGKFPKPVRFSERVVVWDSRAVNAWLEAKFAGVA